MSVTMNQQQFQEMSSAYSSAVFNFHSAYTSAYTAATQAGVASQQAAITALEAAHRAAANSFLDSYVMMNSIEGGSYWAGVAADSMLASSARADALLNDTRTAQAILNDCAQKAASDYSGFIGNNPYLKAAGSMEGQLVMAFKLPR